jgi:metallo-beta-lactamase family protein
VHVALRFLGAAGTVTGSRLLLTHGSQSSLIDCGLFQGTRELRDRNWDPFPVEVDRIRRIVLTHAHIDHSGFLPRLLKEGYRRAIWATPATVDLLQIVLPDAGHLQEEEASWHNRHRSARHDPALPLFTEEDARRVLDLLRPLPYDQMTDLGAGVSLRLVRAGHILGSAFVEVRFPGRGPGEEDRILFTGDLGRPGQPILKDPTPISRAGVLVMESTYGDREHPREDPRGRLEEIVNQTAHLGGVVVIPAFAIGRTQLILYLLRELQEQKRIPTLPVYLDSPMAINAVPFYCRHTEEHDLDMLALTREEGCPILLPNLHTARTREESKALNNLSVPAIILSASGMATGGRVVHHLRNRLPDPRNAVVFVGYQAQGTRGRLLQEGAREVSIYGQEVRVRAHIHTLSGLSAHADVAEILDWLGHFEAPPRTTYLVHGEPRSAEALAATLRARLGWRVEVARYLDEVEISPS